MRKTARNSDVPLTGEEVRARLVAQLPVTEDRFDLAGIPTAVLAGGSGEPLVLVHGLGEFGPGWAGVLADLTRTHRVVVPDLPGHGASGLGDSTLNADRMVAWLDELLEATCGGPPVLVGHLLGGAVALRHTIVHGDRVRGLALVDSLGLARYRPSAVYTLALVRFLVHQTEQSQVRLFKQCFLDYDAARAGAGQMWPLIASYALDRARSPELKTAARSLGKHVGAAVAAEDLARITVPVTLIHGRHDRQVRLGAAEASSDLYGWPLHVIEGAADDPAFEQPDAFVEALRVALPAG